ncbi:lytic murein transglycosylase [Nioella nitratireducens]|uniref:lytic murein transglycosylase n=1 Tax=Nioella nitratireducens TaxID=1287720 RepID=UPI0008FD56A9|nr:lytic murein transglycosylase [Nioella nitratireducens]
MRTGIRQLVGVGVALLATGASANTALSLRPLPRPPITASSDPTERAVIVSIRPAMRQGTAPLVTRAEATPVSTSGFSTWMTEFSRRARAAGIRQATLDRAFAGISLNQRVIERDQNQAEFSRTLWDYLDSAASDTRVANGRAALREHRATLARIERRYGVEAEIVTAIWGLESAYGTFRGEVPIIEAMATLAYEGRRQEFFEAQLIAALRIVQAGDTDPAHLRGSWAGAMGHTQFMPTSFLAHAVDFTGDGRRDIWGDDPTDALASTARYLSENGWTHGQPWALEVTLPSGFDFSQSGETVRHAAAHWNAMGVRLADGGRIPDHGPSSILLPAGHRGVALVIYENFHVIETYNPADAYVIGVGHLADRIAGAAEFRGGWPREDRALSNDERFELQRRLTAAGFSTRRVDGIIGPLTIQAVREYQSSEGLVPDGYASETLLRRLRRG